MSKELAKLFAKRYIARSDVKAVQFDKDAGNFHAGDWFPDTKIDPSKRPNSPHLPHGFNMEHLLAHIEGRRTYGHYLLDKDSTCKVFCLDIDLKAKTDEWSGTWVKMPNWEDAPKEINLDKWAENQMVVTDCDPLALWRDRSRTAAPARAWFKYQMKMLSAILLSKCQEAGIECAAAYSGSKGVHVYGFTDRMPAKEVRDAALLVLELTDEFQPAKGKNFYKHTNNDPVHGFSNFSIEVFPKQDTLDGKSLGNLVRLPLGVNHKNAKDPTFFLDMTTGYTHFGPHPDPVRLLTEGNPFV